MAQLKMRNTKTLTRRSLVAAIALAAAAFALSGCASNTARQWAQTSPVIAAEPQDTAVQMGARGG